MKKVYFVGAIRGSREKANEYKKIGDFIEEYAEILDRHVVDPELSDMGESLDETEIYERDIEWIAESDIVFAEVTMPSLGVGYEIAYAEKLGKKIVCLCHEGANLSAMIHGDSNLEVIFYNDVEELQDVIKERLQD